MNLKNIKALAHKMSKSIEEVLEDITKSDFEELDKEEMIIQDVQISRLCTCGLLELEIDKLRFMWNALSMISIEAYCIIQAGVTSEEYISEFLGINEDTTQDILEALVKNNLIKESNSIYTVM